jgi:hypothetical protein
MRRTLRRSILLLTLFAVFGAVAATSTGAPARATASCKLRPFYTEYLCDYYGFLSGVHSERWTVDYDYAKLHPGERCPYGKQHSKGGVDVTYRSARSGPRRAAFATRWRNSRAPYDLSGWKPYLFLTITLKRFAEGSGQDPVGPPDECNGDVFTIDPSKCGTRTFNLPKGTFETNMGRSPTERYIVNADVELKDFQDCADGGAWSLNGGAATKYFAPARLISKPKFTMQGTHREVVPLRTYGQTLGKVIVTDKWTWTFCQKGKIPPARCRP